MITGHIVEMKQMSLRDFQEDMATNRTSEPKDFSDCEASFQYDVNETYSGGPVLMVVSRHDRVLGVSGHLELFKEELEESVRAHQLFWETYYMVKLASIKTGKKKILQEAAKAFMRSGLDTSVLRQFFDDANAAAKSIEDTTKAHLDKIKAINTEVLGDPKHTGGINVYAKACEEFFFNGNRPASWVKPSKALNTKLAATYKVLTTKV